MLGYPPAPPTVHYIINFPVTSLGAYPFTTTAQTGRLYVNRGTPPSATQGLTPNDSKWTLYVPVGCKSAYQKAAVWKNFKSIVEESSLEKGDDYTDDGSGSGGNDDSGGESYKTCPDNNHPHMIDLGLPSGTKWACCNVGASKPEEYGNYYAWGEISPKRGYSWSTYQYGSYFDNVVKIGSDIADTQYDAATANWGTPWRMPSLTQVKELLNSCTSSWATLNGVNGRKLTGSNGSTLFLPAAGTYSYGELEDAGSRGSYNMSTLDTSTSYRACGLFFNSSKVYWDYGYLYWGHSVRPVR